MQIVCVIITTHEYHIHKYTHASKNIYTTHKYTNNTYTHMYVTLFTQYSIEVNIIVNLCVCFFFLIFCYIVSCLLICNINLNVFYVFIQYSLTIFPPTLGKQHSLLDMDNRCLFFSISVAYEKSCNNSFDTKNVTNQFNRTCINRNCVQTGQITNLVEPPSIHTTTTKTTTNKPKTMVLNSIDYISRTIPNRNSFDCENHSNSHKVHIH